MRILFTRRKLSPLGRIFVSCLLLWAMVISGVIALTGCVGTFTLSPDGSVKYSPLPIQSTK